MYYTCLWWWWWQGAARRDRGAPMVVLLALLRSYSLLLALSHRALLATTLTPVYEADYGFDDDGWGDANLPISGDALIESSPIAGLTDLLKNPKVMGNLETLLAESYKFIRMADDLHAMTKYMNDMRLCVIAITISIYIALIIYLAAYCFRRNKHHRRRRQDVEFQANSEMYDYQMNERATPQAATVITNSSPSNPPARDVGVRYTSGNRPASYQRSTKRQNMSNPSQDETTDYVKSALMNREDSRNSPLQPMDGGGKDPLTVSYRPMVRQTTVMKEYKEIPPITPDAT